MAFQTKTIKTWNLKLLIMQNVFKDINLKWKIKIESEYLKNNKVIR